MHLLGCKPYVGEIIAQNTTPSGRREGSSKSKFYKCTVGLAAMLNIWRLNVARA